MAGEPPGAAADQSTSAASRVIRALTDEGQRTGVARLGPVQEQLLHRQQKTRVGATKIDFRSTQLFLYGPLARSRPPHATARAARKLARCRSWTQSVLGPRSSLAVPPRSARRLLWSGAAPCFGDRMPPARYVHSRGFRAEQCSVRSWSGP